MDLQPDVYVDLLHGEATSGLILSLSPTSIEVAISMGAGLKAIRCLHSELAPFRTRSKFDRAESGSLDSVLG
jgi:hypothetical protein